MAYSNIVTHGSRFENNMPKGTTYIQDYRKENQVRELIPFWCSLIFMRCLFRELSNGHFSPDNQKKLTGPGTEIPIFEAKMTGDLRLIVCTIVSPIVLLGGLTITVVSS
jgi:hypothetical protein